MKVDADFRDNGTTKRKENGYYFGVSRRGVPVKIRATPAVEAEIAKWNGVITIQVIDELYQRFLHH